MSIAKNVEKIRRDIAEAAGSGAVLLVAATKMNDAGRVREAVAAGVDACGENRVQEFLEKDALGAYDGAPKHFIGHLQRNKVNKIVGRVDLIQSVDSEPLLSLINRRAAELGIVQDVLVEINIAGETQKSGIDPGRLGEILEKCSLCTAVRVRGLMCVPPISAQNGGNRPYFARMRQLLVDNRHKKYDNVDMEYLSMGMTDDYMDAVREGANMIRIGSAIFGRRDYGAGKLPLEE